MTAFKWLAVAIGVIVVSSVCYDLVTTTSLKRACIERLTREQPGITLSLNSDSTETSIESFRVALLNTEGVISVDLLSHAEAEAEFKKKYKNDPEVLQALGQLGGFEFSPKVTIQVENLEIIASGQGFERMLEDINMVAGRSNITVEAMEGVDGIRARVSRIEKVRSFSPMLRFGAMLNSSAKNDLSYLRSCATGNFILAY